MEPTPPEGPSSGRPNVSVGGVQQVGFAEEEVGSATPAADRNGWQPPGQVASETEPGPEGEGQADAERARVMPAAAKTHHDARPPPTSMRAGPSTQLWNKWKTVDADGSGTVSKTEFNGIHSALGIPKAAVDEAWLEAVAFMRGRDVSQLTLLDALKLDRQECNYYAFVHAFNAVRGSQRRAVRQQVRSTFLVMQKQPSGLRKNEMGKFIKRVSRQLMLLPPEFDLESDWEDMRGLIRESPSALLATVGGDDAQSPRSSSSRIADDMGTLMHEVVDHKKRARDDSATTISFAEFEKWWKCRMGLWETNQAVIPEFYEYKLSEAGNVRDLTAAALDTAEVQDPKDAGAVRERWRILAKKSRGHRTGPELWTQLRAKMKVVMSILKGWGDMDNRARDTSIVHTVTLPWFIRDPESKFSGVWDVASVFFLLYVCVSVPVRACFPTDIIGNRAHLDVFSGVWVIDTIADLYFIIDVVLNFFTALPNRHDGTPIADQRQIAEHYIRGWFLIDFISSLPIDYVTMLIESIAGQESDGTTVDLRFLKSMRLLRLSKMLRLARIKRLLTKYDNLAKVQEYGGIVVILLIIFAAAHVMTCFWYLSGSTDEVVQGELRVGWVNAEWSPASDTSVSLATRYTAALYRTFNVMDLSTTSGERQTAVLYHMLIVVLDGAVAGVMSAMMISMQGQEREYNTKMSQAKQWMKEQRIPKFRAEPAMEYFRTIYKSHVATREGDILASMTPAMKVEFATFLYSKFVSKVPLFRDLSPGIIRALCGIVEPTFAVRKQVIYGEGTTGREMYIVISGELEITSAGTRLGFISDGGFFGETPLLESTAFAEVRRRTVTAVTACKLVFLRASRMHLLINQYPELAMRIKRCSIASGKTKGKNFEDAMMNARNAGLEVKRTQSSVFDSKKSRARPSKLGRSSTMIDVPMQSPRLLPADSPTTSPAGEPMGNVDFMRLDRKFSAMANQQQEILSRQDEMASNQEAIFASLAKMEATLVDLSRAVVS